MAAKKGVYHKSIQAGKWFVFANICQKIINLAPFFILARLLRPADYGVIAVVFMIIGFLDRFSAPGFTSALMVRQKQTEYFLPIIWTYELCKAGVIATLLYLGGGILSNFFHVDPQYALIIKLSGILPIIAALSNPRQFYFFADLQGKKIFWRDTWAQLAYLVVSIGVAYVFTPTAWALFAGYVGRYVIANAVSYILAPAWPKLSFHFMRLRELVPYGKWIYGQTVLDYFLGFLDNFIVGRVLGTDSLGLYTRARDLPSTVSAPLLGIMTKVSFPAFSKLQDSRQKIKDGFLRSLDVLLPLNVLFSLLLALEGGALVTALLGEKWLAIVVPLKILAVANIFSAFVVMIKPVFNALNRPQINVKLGIFQLLLSGVSIFAGVQWWGLSGAAMAVLLVWIILWLLSIMAMRSVIAVSKQELLPVLSGVAVASFGVLVLDVLLRGYWHAHGNPWLIVLWVGLLSTVYIGLIIFIGKGFKTGPWYTFKSILAEVGLRRF